MKLDTHGATMPSITTMLSAIAQRRSDPAAARQMIDSIFRGASESAKRSYCQFLFASIAHLSRDNPDRWGVTLREYGVRLNAGWVESLVLWKGEPLRVLIEQKSAPAAVTFVTAAIVMLLDARWWRSRFPSFPFVTEVRLVAPTGTGRRSQQHVAASQHS